MTRSDIQKKVEEKLAQCEPDVELISAENSGTTLRLYIDHPSGVDHELCARVTAQTGDFLQQFSLEVSSPGLERPLTKPEHFMRFTGDCALVETLEPVEGRRKFKGRLRAFDQDHVLTVECQDRLIKIPYKIVKRSHLLVKPDSVWPDIQRQATAQAGGEQ